MLNDAPAVDDAIRLANLDSYARAATDELRRQRDHWRAVTVGADEVAKAIARNAIRGIDDVLGGAR